MFHILLPDVLPTGDLAIRKAFATHFNLRSPLPTSRLPSSSKSSSAKKAEKTKDGYYLPTPEEMEVLSEGWKPWRSVASWYLWRMGDVVTM
jgi:DNA-3-methyladenine glycosylase II